MEILINWIGYGQDFNGYQPQIQFIWAMKDFLGFPKKAFPFPISHLLPGRQQLRNNPNFRGINKDELREHCTLFFVVITMHLCILVMHPPFLMFCWRITLQRMGRTSMMGCTEAWSVT